jgi:hypothetical protein
MKDSAIVILFLLCGLTAVGWLHLSQSPQDQSLVMFHPSEATAFQKIIAAGGKPLRDGGWSGLYIVQHDDGPNFAKNIRAAGAWLVTDPIIAGGCAYSKTRKQGLTNYEGVTNTPFNSPDNPKEV